MQPDYAVVGVMTTTASPARTRAMSAKAFGSTVLDRERQAQPVAVSAGDRGS
jgi:hypothetical protein